MRTAPFTSVRLHGANSTLYLDTPSASYMSYTYSHPLDVNLARVMCQVPMDQPEVAVAMLNAFVHEDSRPFKPPAQGSAGAFVISY